MELLQALKLKRSEMPDEMMWELNELWTRFEAKKYRIMAAELEDAINMQFHPEADAPPFERRIYIEEFVEHWKVLSLLEETKKQEYEIYKKHGRL